MAEASKTLQPGFNPTNYTFHGRTASDDDFTDANTIGADVFCGFGGVDRTDALQSNDIFLGGDGIDFVQSNFGTFYGGAGNDIVSTNSSSGTFNGGEGNDLLFDNTGTFNGEAGDDHLDTNLSGGTFNGGADNDHVRINNGIFNGGAGFDSVFLINTGTLISVEVVPIRNQQTEVATREGPEQQRPGRSFLLYSPKCVETEFWEVGGHRPL